MVRLGRHGSIGFWHHQAFVAPEENTDNPIDSNAWLKAIHELNAALAAALGAMDSP